MSRLGKTLGRAPEPTGAATLIRLRIIATSDLHAHLFPFNYFTDRRDDGVGLVRAASLIEALRAEVENCLLVDNGDTLQGAPLGDVALSDIVPGGRTHPMVAAMNALGYDAATLGNHDFDYGLPFLREAIAGAEYPVVLANAMTRDGAPLFARHAILDRTCLDADGTAHAVRVGVIGVAPPQIVQWGRGVLEGALVMEDMQEAVRREIGLLRDKGADLVLVLAHTGLGHRTALRGAENAACAIARLPGVDAVIAGHSHAVEAEATLWGAPLVQPGFWGSHVGVIDLSLLGVPQGPAPQDGPRRWARIEACAQTHTMANAGPDARRAFRKTLRKVPALRGQLARDHRQTRAFSARPLGRTSRPLQSYFSLLAPCAVTTVLADATRRAAQDLLADRPDLSDLPLVTAVAPFRAGGRGGPQNFVDIPAGVLQLRHAADLYIYPNSMAVLRVTGAQVRDWLERVASAFHRIDPTAPSDPAQPLIDHAFAPYNFDTLDGLRYAFDLSQIARTNAEGDELRGGPGRVRELSLADGTPLQPSDEVVIVTNSYRAAGGGHFPAAAAAEVLLSGSDPVRDAVARHLSQTRDLGAVTPRDTWRFVPLGGQRVRVETGPGALAHPDRITELGLVADGLSESGFQRFLWTI